MAEFQNAIDALKHHVEHRGDSLAYQTIDSFGKVIDTVDYQALWYRSHSIAQTITTFTQPGDRVILLYENSIEMISALLGCMISHTIAIPCAPLKGSLSPTAISIVRLMGIANNANPSLILSNEQYTQRLLTYSKSNTPIVNNTHQPIKIINTEAITTTTHTASIRLNSIAYLQYTSGTTGVPKGVILSHDNVSNNVHHLIHHANTSERERLQTAVNWLPLHHDMGLINAVFIPLYLGCPSILLSPFSFLKRPVTWLTTISQYPGVTSGAPCFAFAHCCKYITEDQRKNLDLSSWALAFVGSDSSKIEQITAFIDRFQDYQLDPTIFHPCYGLAEATVHVCGDWRLQGLESHAFDRGALQAGVAKLSTINYKTLIAHGKPFNDHGLYIVDRDTQEQLPEKCLGEIWIKGPSVASGYWNNKSISKETFNNKLEGHEGIFLKTGDIGFMMNNQLYITGRLKDTLIIRGQNIAPDDIEWIVMRNTAQLQYGQVAAFSIEENHEEQLIVLIHQPRYPIEEREILLESAYTAILNQLGIQPKKICLIKAPALPLTTSGKLNRIACKKLYLEHQYTILSSFKRY
ncbi:MAG: hypothetical protein CL816_06190 [Coxiellaceae bacterium]|nr:hypothetical protein [Coxiellaceae bacterium]|tara:strand:+ start:333 stop:2066 length:1734 start_codon:yes stop_codon:yes gene_type:complete